MESFPWAARLAETSWHRIHDPPAKQVIWVTSQAIGSLPCNRLPRLMLMPLLQVFRVDCKRHAVWYSNLLLCVRYTGIEPLFEQAGCSPMGFEMRGVNHQFLHSHLLTRKLHEDFIEDSHPAPPDESIVECFVGSVFPGSVFPLKAVFDHVNDSTDDLFVIYSTYSMGERGK